MFQIRPVAAFAFCAAIAAAGQAGAQMVANGVSLNNTGASYNAGYGRYADQENQPVQVGVRDANGNLVILDGLIQTGPDQSGFAGMATAGAFDSVAGVATGSGSTAIGNNLQVVTQGDYNTVIVNSQQTNTGTVSASTSH